MVLSQESLIGVNKKDAKLRLTPKKKIVITNLLKINTLNHIATMWLQLLRAGLMRDKGEVSPINFTSLFFSIRTKKNVN